MYTPVLHPSYKTQYFRDQGWEEEWIAQATDLARTEWTTYYKPQDDVVEPAAPAGPAAPGPGRHSAQRASRLVRTLRYSRAFCPANCCVSQPSTPALFASISNRDKAAAQDALEAYLEAPPLATIQDPLEYWNVVLKTSNSPLAQMAIDYLTAQGT